MALLWGRAVHPRALAGVAAAGGGLARACTNSSLVVENVVTRGSTRQRDLARSAFRQGRSAFETASYAAVDFRVEAVRSMVRSMSSKSASGREDQSSSATPGQRDQGEEVPEGKVGFRRPAQNPPIKTGAVRPNHSPLMLSSQIPEPNARPGHCFQSTRGAGESHLRPPSR